MSKKIKAVCHDSVACPVGADGITSKAFDDADPFFSNQGECGTCCRHAIAKAIQYQITSDDAKINVSTEVLVNILMTLRSDKGAHGALVTDWDWRSATFCAKDGATYSFKLSIIERSQLPVKSSDSYVGTVVAVDMRSILPQHYGACTTHRYHAMYCESETDSELIVRNSWGSSFQKLTISKSEPSLWIYHVFLPEFLQQHYPDIKTTPVATRASNTELIKSNIVLHKPTTATLLANLAAAALGISAPLFVFLLAATDNYE